MSDTPRTDERILPQEGCVAVFELVSANFARGLEREIAQSNRIIEAQYRGVINSERILSEALGVNDGSEILDAIQALKERVKRLEAAGNELAMRHLMVVKTYDDAKLDVKEWEEAKEAA